MSQSLFCESLSILTGRSMNKSVNLLSLLIMLVTAFMTQSCAYKVGQKLRSLPGGYQRLSIPVIKNKSMEPGAESIVTQALKEEFFRSTVLKVVNDNDAEVRLEGQIDSLKYESNPSGIKASDPSDTKNFLPTGTVLTTSYNMTIIISLKLVKTATLETLWQSQFSGSRAMNASQVTIAGINSVNPIYNQNAKRQVLESVVADLSNQIHNNLTENF